MPAINATGVWTEVNYGQACLFASGKKGELCIIRKDRDILKRLAEKVREYSESAENTEKINLWYEHNSLKTYRPVIFCEPENGWNEIITEDQLECKGSLAKRWEIILLKEIFYISRMKDDKPIEPYFDIGYTFEESDWLEKEIIRGGKNGGSYVWEAQVKDESDVCKVRQPEITVDYKTTLETFNLACEVFNGLLKPRIKGLWWWSFGLTNDLVRIIGLKNMMIYFYDKPGLIHKLMEILRDGNIRKLDFLEENNLLTLNNNGQYVGSGGMGYSSEIPCRDLICNDVKTKDLWGFAESQETVNVSTAMFEEFVFNYQLPILERFGLNCYGCCEPLDKRWDVVKKTPNLRRVSVSAWADLIKMRDYLEDKYIFSYKPAPSDLAVPEINELYIRKKISDFLDITKGCIIEILMKDNHTISHNPENVINWVRITREEINKRY